MAFMPFGRTFLASQIFNLCQSKSKEVHKTENLPIMHSGIGSQVCESLPGHCGD